MPETVAGASLAGTPARWATGRGSVLVCSKPSDAGGGAVAAVIAVVVLDAIFAVFGGSGADAPPKAGIFFPPPPPPGIVKPAPDVKGTSYTRPQGSGHGSRAWAQTSLGSDTQRGFFAGSRRWTTSLRRGALMAVPGRLILSARRQNDKSPHEAAPGEGAATLSQTVSTSPATPCSRLWLTRTLRCSGG